jgi:drug/metabolite transporter (DMT)-like permease
MLHFKRGLAGVLALSMWFYSMAQLPLATAVTLNYMSSVWMAVFLLLQSVIVGGPRLDRRLVVAIGVGFVGVALVLRPTLSQDQIWAGLIGLTSGMLAAMAYLQVTALGKAGEPEVRVVFYFSLMGAVDGGCHLVAAESGQRNVAARHPWPLVACAGRSRGVCHRGPVADDARLCARQHPGQRQLAVPRHRACELAGQLAV